MEDYLEINKLENIYSKVSLVMDYDTAYFYWNITNNREKSMNKSMFNEYLQDKNMSFSSISTESFTILNFEFLNNLNPYNIYNESDTKLILSANSLKRKYSYNEAFYLWMKKSIFLHIVVLNRGELYFKVDFDTIKDIVEYDSKVFYTRMKNIRDNYPDYFPIRSQSYHIFDKSINFTSRESDINEDYDRYDDLEILLGRYKGRIHQIEELDMEYDCSKNCYINNLIIKNLIDNVCNKKI